ncbi:MAG TPA: isoprenylcysteine carboxylmethyltransferase family protein [Rhizomicrobium sp.]|jgi:protein-S-isoprenylcysteine O-methyltransferase Ste14
MQPRNLLSRLFLQTGIMLILMAAALFGAAGYMAWPQAWTFLAIFVANSAGFGFWLVRRDPDLLAARLASPIQRGQPLWDKIFLLLFMAIWFGWLVLMGLDAQRWHTSHMPAWFNLTGAVLIIAGFLGVSRVFAENSFAAPVVRVQAERSQRVIDSGPYAIVRHPMYAAALLYVIGIPLLLGSWHGAVCVLLFILGIASRAVFEERLLVRDLPGYAAYAARVRYRIIPGVW